jgi:hypothetical protein
MSADAIIMSEHIRRAMDSLHYHCPALFSLWHDYATLYHQHRQQAERLALLER